MKLFKYFLLFVSVTAMSQVQPYQIYTAKGKKISFEKMVKQLSKTDIVLFGELHNNTIAHYMQVKLAKSLHEIKREKLIIGAEMFERDQENILKNFLNGTIEEQEFEKQMRLWSNYKTDYKPLLKFAKKHQIKYIATNVPRRYASMLFRNGIKALDTLTVEEKAWIAPLPFPYDKSLPGYVKMMDMFNDSNHTNENFPKAQAIKDATMGYFIVQNLEPNSIFLHLNGAYHSDNYEGIMWYINQYAPEKATQTITVVEQIAVNTIDDEHLNKANFIIVVDADMPKSYE